MAISKFPGILPHMNEGILYNVLCRILVVSQVESYSQEAFVINVVQNFNSPPRIGKQQLSDIMVMDGVWHRITDFSIGGIAGLVAIAPRPTVGVKPPLKPANGH